MKSILQYGQTVYKRNRAMADNMDVYQAGIVAMKDGYNIRQFERIVTPAGVTIIRKCKRKGEGE